MYLSTQKSIILFLFSLLFIVKGFSSDPPEKKEKTQHLNHIKTIKGKISPKSIVHNKNGVFFAQNMMYRHTVTVYDRSYKLVKTISDKVKLSDYGEDKYKGTYKGAPVECAFSHDGKYAWVSNYEMRGGSKYEFNKPGCDGCTGKKYDKSYVYKINTKTYDLEDVIKVGSVPKYLAATPDNKLVLVTNWTSGDLSVISTETNKEIKRIKLGRLPRGIEVNSKSTYAYVAIMGSNKIAKINLYNYTVSWIKNVGRGPRHICISPDDKYLYVSINNEGKVVRIDLDTYEKTVIKTGSNPRSMILSEDGKFLYVVNYSSNRLSKVDTKTMTVVDESRTNSKPIGITFDDATKNIWVACYTGRIMVFHDTYYDDEMPDLIANKGKDLPFKFLSYDYISKGKEKTKKEADKNQALTLREIAELMAMKGEDRTVEKVEKKVVAKSKSITTNKKTSKEKTVSKEIKSKSLTEKKKTTAPSKKSSNTKKKETIATKESSSIKGYLVVTGSFRSPSNAKRRKGLMKQRGYDAKILYNSVKDLHMVYVENFKSRSDANNFKSEKKLNAWVYNAK